MINSHIEEIDSAQFAQQIHKLMDAAYRVEAHLLGLDDFLPLHRTARDIAISPNRFYGFFQHGELLGVCELEELADDACLIASTVVDPTSFRKGIASSLLTYVLDSTTVQTIVVSTAEGNHPSVRLYQRHGFVVDSLKTTPDGIRLITLRYGRSGQLETKS